MSIFRFCKFLCFTLILLYINGVTYSYSIDILKPSTHVLIFRNALKQTNPDKFKQWEIEINEKIKKEQYNDALAQSKKMEEEATRTNEAYWLCISHYYCGLSAKYIRDYKTSLHYFLQIIQSKNNSFAKDNGRLCNVFRHTADVYKKLNTYPEAITYYKKSIDLKEKINDKGILVPAYVNLGSVYSSQSKFADARECYLDGLELIKGKDEHIASTIYNNLGNDEYSQGNYTQAIAYYMHSIQISEKANDYGRLALSYNNLGNIYTNELKSPQQAIVYYTKSLDIEKKQKNDEGIATELINIGNVLASQSKFKEAEKTFGDALPIFERINNMGGITKTLENLGVMYTLAGNNSKAISSFKKCIEIREKNNDEINLVNVYTGIATIYYNQKTYEQSLYYCFKALESAKRMGNKSQVQHIYDGIYKAYEGLGKYNQAYKYLLEYSKLKDTLLNATISKQIIDIQEKYEKSKMEQKVALQNLEIKNKSLQRNGVLAFLVLAIILFSTALFFIFQKRKNEKLLYLQNSQIKDKEIKNLVQQSEIKSMLSLAEGQENERQRISRELHDRVGSMLSLVKLNLSSYSDDDKPFIKENLTLLDNTYQEVRNISHNLHSGLLTQFGLKAALSDLKNTIESHNAMRFNLFFHLEELSLPKETEVIIFKVLQELVTNALKHADAKNIDIQIISDENGFISVTVEDDGKGFDVQLNHEEGIGLKNIRYRISSLGGSLEVNSSPGKGACFLISIPAVVLEHKNAVS